MPKTLSLAHFGSAYRGITDGEIFAIRLGDDLVALSGDKHIGVDFFAKTIPGPEPARDPRWLAETLVGETTGGGAHVMAPHRIDDHFVIRVPFARFVNPITKTDWEGAGVEPNVKISAAEALTPHDTRLQQSGPILRRGVVRSVDK